MTDSDRGRGLPTWFLIPIVALILGGGYFAYEEGLRRQENRPATSVGLTKSDDLIKSMDLFNQRIERERELRTILADPITNSNDVALQSLLTSAVRARESELVGTILRRSRPKVRQEAVSLLSESIRMGDVATTKVLLDGGVPAQGSPPSRYAASTPAPTTPVAGTGLYEDRLSAAIAYRSLGALRLLLAAGADPNHLMWLTRDQIGTIVDGVEIGAAIDYPDPKTRPPKERTLVKVTPRVLATMCGDRAMIRLFDEAARRSRNTGAKGKVPAAGVR